MADYTYTLDLTTDLNQAVGLNSTITVPATATFTDFTGITAIKVASFSTDATDFTITSDLVPQTITIDASGNDAKLKFNISAYNQNPPWGNVVIEAVTVSLSTYGVSLSAGVISGTMQKGLSNTLAGSLSSTVIWASEAEHARRYVQDEL